MVEKKRTLRLNHHVIMYKYVSKLKVNCKFGRLGSLAKKNLQAIPIFSSFQFPFSLHNSIDFFNCNSFVHDPIWHESDFFSIKRL